MWKHDSKYCYAVTHLTHDSYGVTTLKRFTNSQNCDKQTILLCSMID